MKLNQIVATYVKPNPDGISIIVAMDMRKALIKCINSLRQNMSDENSLPEDKEREFDFAVLTKELECAQELLVQLKCSIAVSNSMSGAIENIIREDEINGLLKFYEELETAHGPTEMPTGKYTDETKSVVMVAQLRKSEVQEKIAELEMHKVENKNQKAERSAVVAMTRITPLVA